MATIRARTKDGEIIVVSRETIMLTKPVKDMYEKAKMTSGGEEAQFDEINLDVEAAQLRQAVEWLEKHRDNDYTFTIDESTGERSWAELTAEDKQLLDPMKLWQYIPLMEAAHYLGIDSLRFAIAQSIASKLKEMDVDQMRNYFGEKDDLTERDKELIRQEDVWANY